MLIHTQKRIFKFRFLCNYIYIIQLKIFFTWLYVVICFTKVSTAIYLNVYYIVYIISIRRKYFIPEQRFISIYLFVLIHIHYTYISIYPCIVYLYISIYLSMDISIHKKEIVSSLSQNQILYSIYFYLLIFIFIYI